MLMSSSRTKNKMTTGKYIRTEKTKKKMSISAKIRANKLGMPKRKNKIPKNPFSKGNTFAKLGIGMKHRHHSKETKEKMSNGNVIHHLNGNHSDDREENKILVSRRIHTKLHYNSYLFLSKKGLIDEYIKWFNIENKLNINI